MALLDEEYVEFNGLRISKRLTDQEVNVIRLVAEGRTNVEIAEALHLSENTIKTYLSRITVKFGHDRGDRALIAVTAMRRGLIT